MSLKVSVSLLLTVLAPRWASSLSSFPPLCPVSKGGLVGSGLGFVTSAFGLVSILGFVASALGFTTMAFGLEISTLGLAGGALDDESRRPGRSSFVGTRGGGSFGGAAGATGMTAGGLRGVGGFTISDALDRGESSTNDDGDDAIVARAEADTADIGLNSVAGNGTGDLRPFTYAGYRDIGSVLGDCGRSEKGRCGTGVASSAVGDGCTGDIGALGGVAVISEL